MPPQAKRLVYRPTPGSREWAQMWQYYKEAKNNQEKFKSARNTAIQGRSQQISSKQTRPPGNPEAVPTYSSAKPVSASGGGRASYYQEARDRNYDTMPINKIRSAVIRARLERRARSLKRRSKRRATD